MVVTPEMDFKQMLPHGYCVLGLNWRDTIFKLCLLRNTIPHKIFIKSDPDQLADLMKQVSPGCGIPLKAVVASEELSPNQLEALASYGTEIVEMRFWNVRHLNVEATLDVPHVRKLEVGIMDGSVFYSEDSSMAGLLESIANSSIRLESFSLWVYLQENVDITRNRLPNKLSSLYLSYRSGLQLEQILESNDLPNLTSLEISFAHSFSGYTRLSSEILSRAVNLTSRKLKRLVVKHRDDHFEVTLSLARFIFLEELDIEARLGTEEPDDVPFSDVVPRLRKLTLGENVLKNTPQHMEFLTRNDSTFTKLERLNVFMTSKSPRPYEHQALDAFSRFPAVNLTHFHLGAFSEDMAKMLPIVYSQMTSLRQLNITTYNHEPLERLIVGCSREYYRFSCPYTAYKHLWPTCLHGNTSAVTNLSSKLIAINPNSFLPVPLSQDLETFFWIRFGGASGWTQNAVYGGFFNRS